jgi:hypothetical protein
MKKEKFFEKSEKNGYSGAIAVHGGQGSCSKASISCLVRVS